MGRLYCERFVNVCWNVWRGSRWLCVVTHQDGAWTIDTGDAFATAPTARDALLIACKLIGSEER